jgi:hypothetical protein
VGGLLRGRWRLPLLPLQQWEWGWPRRLGALAQHRGLPCIHTRLALAQDTGGRVLLRGRGAPRFMRVDAVRRWVHLLPGLRRVGQADQIHAPVRRHRHRA